MANFLSPRIKKTKFHNPTLQLQPVCDVIQKNNDFITEQRPTLCFQSASVHASIHRYCCSDWNKLLQINSVMFNFDPDRTGATFINCKHLMNSYTYADTCTSAHTVSKQQHCPLPDTVTKCSQSFQKFLFFMLSFLYLFLKSLILYFIQKHYRRISSFDFKYSYLKERLCRVVFNREKF